MSATGYTFQGWSTSSTATSAEYAGGASYTPSKDITLYAVWKANNHTVSYNKGDATSGSAPSAQTKVQGTPLTLAKNTGSLAHSSTTGSAPSKTGKITLSYNANGGTNAPSSTSGSAVTINGTYPITWTASGWGTTSGTTTKAYEFGGSYTKEEDITLYPSWTKTNGTTTYTPASASATVSTSKPSKTGYTFEAWYTASSGGTKVGTTYSESITDNKTVTLYAHWTANTYSIKFNGNGNTGGSMSNLSMTYDTAKTLTANAFTKTGYSFAGWATSASGAVAYADKASVKNLSSTSGDTVNLYAKWTANIYTITLNDIRSDATAGQGKIYVRYEDSFYKEKACTNKITKLDILPTSPRPQFFGYQNQSGTKQIIDAEGNILVSSTAYTNDNTINAIWKDIPFYQKSGSQFKLEIPYIIKNGQWKKCTPYVLKNGRWVKYFRKDI